MKFIKKKSFLIAFFASVIVLLSSVVILLTTSTTASAFVGDSLSDYTFTQITTESGESAYKVGVKSTCRSRIQIAMIPEEYNGFPVVEIADNGFSTCKNLIKAYIPDSVKTIGINAFRNCAKLEYAKLTETVTIKKCAFGLCPKLTLSIPETTTTVGESILQNNPNTLFVCNSEEFVESAWDNGWNDLHTGDVVFNSQPDDEFEYRLITDKNGNYGVEITQTDFYENELELVLYNAIIPEGYNEYLPVLNICKEAFGCSALKSVTFKNIIEADTTATDFNHKINVESGAFAYTCVEEIHFETEITLYDSYENYKQNNEKLSTEIFNGAFALKSVTLPANLSVITDNIFSDCTELCEIRINGKDYDGKNVLPNVTFIGDNAFANCTNLNNIYIPSTVTSMGTEVFNNWGEYVASQNIHVDFYEDECPWDATWTEGIHDNVVINYIEPTKVIIVLNDQETIEVNAKVGRPMPSIDEYNFDKKGYIFKGIFSDQVSGVRFYQSNKQSARDWEDAYPTMLYAQWDAKKSILTFNHTGEQYPVQFDSVMPEITKPTKVGYTFNGYFLEDEKGKDYYYNNEAICDRKWDREDENVTFIADWQPLKFNIDFQVDDWKGQQNPNENYYFYGENYEFQKLELKGYEFNWSPSGVKSNDMTDLTVVGTWKAITKYKITYNLNGGTNHPDNKSELLVGGSMTLKDASKPGYNFLGWYTKTKGQRIEEIKNLNSDLELNAAWEGTEYVLKAQDEALYVNKNYSIVQLPVMNFISQFTLYVEADCNNVYIYSKFNMPYSINIVVKNRQNDLNMTLKTFTISPYNGIPGIEMKQGTLYLTAVGAVTIYGGHGADGYRGYGGTGSGYDGKPGIYCNRLVVLEASNLYIEGGKGGNGLDGLRGDDGKDGTRLPGGSIFNPIDGESGEHGKNGENGGHGGNGAPAIYSIAGYISITQAGVKLVGGSGGDGGDGGDGGNGGNGVSDSNGSWINGVGNPGNGGNAGNGGDGGNGGKGANVANCYIIGGDATHLNSLPPASNGKVGIGGTAGKIGLGGSNGFIGANGRDGEPGDPGKDGGINS